MQLPIYFRAWIEEYQELLPVLSIDFVNSCFYVLPVAELEGGSQVEIKGLEKLEMFSNHYDKNEKEIFSGDILLSTFTRNGITGHQLATVEFFNGAFEARFIRATPSEFNHFTPLHGIQRMWWGDFSEVIGNIHQHPKLLEQR